MPEEKGRLITKNARYAQKAKRGDDIGKYLDMMYDPRKIPPPSAPPTIEDLDEPEPNQSVYSPPLETMTYQREYDGQESADLANSEPN